MNIIMSGTEDGDRVISQIIISGADKVWCDSCGNFTLLRDLVRHSYDEENSSNGVDTLMAVRCPECHNDLIIE